MYVWCSFDAVSIFNSIIYKVLLQQCKGGCIASHETPLNWDWVEKYSRARKRNRPWSLRVGNVVDWWRPFAYTCKKSWNVGFPLLTCTFSSLKYFTTVARKWLAPSSILHLVRVGTLTVRRSRLMAVLLMSITIILPSCGSIARTCWQEHATFLPFLRCRLWPSRCSPCLWRPFVIYKIW